MHDDDANRVTVTKAEDRYDRLQRVLDAAANKQDDSVEELCLAGVELLALNGAGVSVVTDAGQRGIIYSSDGVSEQIERLQVSLGEGPCVDAWSYRLPVFEPDLTHHPESRWPGFGPAARDAGAAAVFSLPLQVGRSRLGAIDVYRNQPGPLSSDDVHDALRLSDALTQVLLRTRPGGSEPDPVPSDEPGFGVEVYQASGMVMVQLDVDVSEAMARLRAHAFSEDRSVQDVAREVVARRLRLERDQ